MPNKRSIEEAAARWIGLRFGGLTSLQERDLATWLHQDPRHRDALARLEGASRALDQLSVHRPIAGTPDPNFKLQPSRKFARFPIAIAAAAAAAVATALVETLHYRAARSYSASAETEIGDLRTMALADGSSIELNTDSVVRVQFSPAERRVQLLRGEAYFSVAKNPSWPFLVSVDGVVVRAAGTAFNIRLRQDAVEVVVTEGRVRLNDAKQGTSLLAFPSAESGSLAEPPVLPAGNRAVIPVANLPRKAVLPASAIVTPLTPAKISQDLSWEHHQLVLDPTPLSLVVAEFNRYNMHKLVIVDPAIAGLLVGGSFHVHDYETFSRLLETNFGVAVERTGNKTLLRARH
jgi:transmembrane sensor